MQAKKNYVFEIPFRMKPKKNNRPIYKNKKTGKYFLGKSESLREFEQEIGFILNAQKNRQGIASPLEGDLCIRKMRFELKGAQRADLDNTLTAALDALQDAGIIANDKQFKLIQNIWLIPNAGRDHTTIEIGPMPGASDSDEVLTVGKLVEQLKAR